MIVLDWKRCQLINKALDLPKPILFDFLVHGKVLRTIRWSEIEYFKNVIPPQRMSELPHEDWVSSVSCPPITSVCVSPSVETESRTLASSSRNFTACLTCIIFGLRGFNVTSLHLHTSPLSSVSDDDGLIGVWDTSIPNDHQRRKTAPANIKQKAPVTVLIAHRTCVKREAYSCGLDSTSGVCINTINVPERPMLDLAETLGGDIFLGASTDHTVSIFLNRGAFGCTHSKSAKSTDPMCIICPELGGAGGSGGADDWMIG
ncbi:hypothetical protein BDR07DRAFT_1474154 [Suillus spraguei]|nr:hypothetical protein BDR07DRAFT_1474154 [Suillus spraguei]